MKGAARLPPAEKHQLSLGFRKLTDSAPLIMAQALGYYENYGLDVTVQREVSWANVRDKQVTGTWHQNHPGSHLRLRLALMEACTWPCPPPARTTSPSASTVRTGSSSRA